MKELKKHLLHEFNTISRKNSKQKTSLNANKVMNAVYNTEILFSVLGFQNTTLIERKRDPMDFKDFEIFLRCFCALCFYCCSLVDVLKHPLSYPLITKTFQGWNSKSQSIDSKIARMNDLLRSFEGHGDSSLSSNTDHSDGGVFWSPIYGTDQKLKKLFRDVGGRTSHIAFIAGHTNLIINDEKLRMQSMKANHSSLSRH